MNDPEIPARDEAILTIIEDTENLSEDTIIDLVSDLKDNKSKEIAAEIMIEQDQPEIAERIKEEL